MGIKSKFCTIQIVGLMDGCRRSVIGGELICGIVFVYAPYAENLAAERILRAPPNGKIGRMR
jgi:hypothetical protein